MAASAAHFALRALNLAERYELQLPGGAGRARVRLKAALVTGPVLACILGRKALRYNVLGSVVGELRRLEESSVPGRARCSQAFADQLCPNSQDGATGDFLDPEFSLVPTGLDSDASWGDRGRESGGGGGSPAHEDPAPAARASEGDNARAEGPSPSSLIEGSGGTTAAGDCASTGPAGTSYWLSYAVAHAPDEAVTVEALLKRRKKARSGDLLRAYFM